MKSGKQRDAETCRHIPTCPPASAADRMAAVLIVAHPEQGWSLLCNGVIAFEDTGAIGDGLAIPPRRPPGEELVRGMPALVHSG